MAAEHKMQQELAEWQVREDRRGLLDDLLAIVADPAVADDGDLRLVGLVKTVDALDGPGPDGVIGRSRALDSVACSMW